MDKGGFYSRGCNADRRSMSNEQQMATHVIREWLCQESGQSDSAGTAGIAGKYQISLRADDMCS